jgi:hypothetical protein
MMFKHQLLQSFRSPFAPIVLVVVVLVLVFGLFSLGQTRLIPPLTFSRRLHGAPEILFRRSELIIYAIDPVPLSSPRSSPEVRAKPQSQSKTNPTTLTFSLIFCDMVDHHDNRAGCCASRADKQTGSEGRPNVTDRRSGSKTAVSFPKKGASTIYSHSGTCWS